MALMRALLALFIGVLLSLPAQAQSGSEPEPFILHADSSGEYVNAHVDYFVDATDRMGVEQIAREANFIPTGGRMGLGATGHALWLRLALQRRADAPSAWRLELGAYEPHSAKFFATDGQGGFASLTANASANIPSPDASFSYRKLLYSITLPDTQARTFYLLVENGNAANILPLRVWQFEHWVGRVMQEYAVYGICFGVMLGLALYNLLLFVRLRDRLFLLYSLLVFSHVLLALNMLGWGSQWLWPEWFDTLPGRSALFACLWAIFAILFANTLFNGPDLSRWIGRVLYGVVAACLITILGVVTGHAAYAPFVTQNAPYVWFPLVLGMAIYRAWRQSLPAVYYLVGYGPVLLGVALLLLALKSLLPANTLVMSFFLGAGAWEAVLFSQALAERVNILKREREAAERHSRERDAELARIEHQRAYFDELTGLANRESLRKSGEAWLARKLEPLVLVLNIDRFKAINDALGYAVGDAVLLETARRLAAIPDTLVGRLHSNQFCILCPQLDRLDDLRRQIAAAFADPLSVNERSVDVTLSVGMVAQAPPATSMATRLRNAEIALHAGRRSFTAWTHYSSDMEAAHRTDLALLSAIRNAVDQHELRLYLQPKVHLDDGSVRSAEALVRWQHPERGMIAPAEFIPFAEQSGCIRYITRWVVQEAMAITRARRDAGTSLQISVNLSMHDLRDPDFVEEMQGLLAATGANPTDIRFEVTESVVMDDPTVMLEVMRALKEQRFSLSVDDFGTGYSSLAYLQKMPVSELKIDRAFVSGTRIGSDAEALLDSIIMLGHRLDLSVVAEGVETEEEWELLRDLGCDYLQGWVVAKAMPVNEFEQWVAENTPFELHGQAPA